MSDQEQTDFVAYIPCCYAAFFKMAYNFKFKGCLGESLDPS